MMLPLLLSNKGLYFTGALPYVILSREYVAILAVDVKDFSLDRWPETIWMLKEQERR